MVRAVAFRMDRLLLDTRSIECAFVRDVTLLFLEYAGVSPECTVEQLRLLNNALTTGLFGSERWDALVFGLRERLAFGLEVDDEFTEKLEGLVRTAAHAPLKAAVHADLILQAVRAQDVRAFGFAYGDVPAYRAALSRWEGARLLTDTLLLSEPAIDPWREFWQQHDCDTSVSRESPKLLTFTGDAFYDPPLAFRIGSPVVLVGQSAQGKELPSVPGPMEVYAMVSDLSSIAT